MPSFRIVRRGCAAAFIATLLAAALARPVIGQSTSGDSAATAASDTVPAADTAPAARGAPLSPTVFRLTTRAMATGFAIATFGATLGNYIDTAKCHREHRGETGGLFGDPCAWYFAQGTTNGWIGGGFIGATTMAAIDARHRGCSLHSAVARSTLGAALGILPGYLLTRHATKFPAQRSAVIFTAPLLSGLAAAAAVHRCHR